MTTPLDATLSGSPVLATASAWAPLRLRMFRWIWIATLVSNIGSWMQTVGAQWLLVGRPNASTLVALVQTAAALPVLLLALPAGVLADVLDLRRLLLASQVFQTAVAAAMALLALQGWLSPALVLGLTFLLGCGASLSLPAQQAIIPELVSREELSSAAALGSINVNLSRAVGPALAGALVAGLGVGAVFGLNAVSFLLFVGVLAVWRRPPRPEGETPERLVAALRAGTRYVRNAPVVRRILLVAGLFVVPAATLWALLPVVANRRLGLGAAGYGVLLGAVGAGAVGGALALARLRARLSDNRILLAAFGTFAAVLLALGLTRWTVLAVAVLLPAGAAWIGVLATLNAEMQLFVPGWVRGRGLSALQIVLFGGMAIASAAWGLVATQVGLGPTFLIAACILLAGAAVVARWPIADVSAYDRSPAIFWAEPDLVHVPQPDAPVLVNVTYDVLPANVPAFLEAMERVRRSRRRTGAARWELYREGEHPLRFIEQFLVPSWEEHLRQHRGRLTGTDRSFQEAASALAVEPPVTTHLIPPWLDAPTGPPVDDVP